MQNNISLVSAICTGCGSCLNICPNNAITFKVNKKGFEYPIINSSKCTNCGLCVKSCHLLNKNDEYFINSFISKSSDIEERKKSQSGALFFEIAKKFIEDGGVVFGCKYENLRVFHNVAKNLDDLQLMRGSKYVESTTKAIFYCIFNHLEKGTKVLFSGTPCQCAGILQFIKIKNPSLLKNLYTLALICHGVPSALIWNECLKYYENRNRSKVKNFIFRDNNYGYGTHYETIFFEDGKIIKDEIYKLLFYSNLVLRESCYSCKYCSVKRPFDITIGDCLGDQQSLSDFKDHKNGGTSLVLIHSKKGLKLFDGLNKCGKVKSREVEIGSVMQPNLKQSVKRSKKVDKFWEKYEKNGFERSIFYAIKTKTFRKINGFILRVNNKIKRLLISLKH